MASYHRPRRPWSDRNVVVAILAEDKVAHCLPRYLKCLDAQTWPRSRTLIYIRTASGSNSSNSDNSMDDTQRAVEEWARARRGAGYVSIHLDRDGAASQRDPRRASVEYAMRHGAHYFVAECGDFIAPSTIEAMCESGCDAIAPVLSGSQPHSNLHFRANAHGYPDQSWCDTAIPELRLRGVIECDIIRRTYFLSHDVLRHAVFDDGTGRCEYAILADQLRKAKVAQYVDNRVDYGRLTFADDLKALEAEPWIGLFPLHAAAEPLSEQTGALSVTYGGERTLRMDVTRQCCNAFLRDDTLVVPKGCDFNARFGDPRRGVRKTLDVVAGDGKLLVSIPEDPPESVEVRVPRSLRPEGAAPSAPAGPDKEEKEKEGERDKEEEKKKKKKKSSAEKWLIISPHAGFGNRLRAVCSGIVLAQQLGRTPVHAWLPEREEDVRLHPVEHHLRETRRLGWDDYFVRTGKIAAVDEGRLRRECKSLRCLTEWMPGDFWYAEQSRFQRRLGELGVAVDRVRVSHDVTAAVLDAVDDTYLLLETSLGVRFTKPHGSSNTRGGDGSGDGDGGGGASRSAVAEERHRQRLSRVYRNCFVPRPAFRNLVASLARVTVGLHVRRGDRLTHVPGADIKLETLAARLAPIVGGSDYVLFSDDRAYRAALVARLPKPPYAEPDRVSAHAGERWRSAFVEFLTLALRCDVVYGTGNSSFSQEAAVFGGKPFVAL